MSLVRIRHPLAIRTERIAPYERFTRSSATSRKFPLRFRRQTLSCPLCVGFGIEIRNMYNRIVVFTPDITLRSQRMPPVRTSYVTPPAEVVVERYRVIGRRKHHRSCKQVL